MAISHPEQELSHSEATLTGTADLLEKAISVQQSAISKNKGLSNRVDNDCFNGILKPIETSTNSHFVILSAAKDLVFTCSYEILRSLRSLRMTGEGTFPEVSNCHYS
jgi:hypothetical protein